MICKTNKELLAFANRINDKFHDLHGLCYSDKSNNIFDQENDSLIDQRDCFYLYIVDELEDDIENDCVNLEYYNRELNKNWDLCNQIEKYFQAVTQTPRPDYIYG